MKYVEWAEVILLSACLQIGTLQQGNNLYLISAGSQFEHEPKVQ